jgi:hypothetical protein
MAIIDADGLFGGNRWRGCSNEAQLHWPRLFLASDGFGRLELNYHKLVARAYSTFSPAPSEAELLSHLQEYSENYLLFVYGVDGQLWGQWDTPAEFLPRYKTAIDRRSPIPPEPEFTDWKKRYRSETKSLPECFGNIPESFLCGKGLVRYGGGKGMVKNTCASSDAPLPVFAPALSIEKPPFDTTEPRALFSREPRNAPKKPSEMTPEQEGWFATWWAEYWLHRARKPARRAFARHVKTAARFDEVMTATRAQAAEMLRREPHHRPQGASWLNGERWTDEPAEPAKQRADVERDEIRRLLSEGGLKDA